MQEIIATTHFLFFSVFIWNLMSQALYLFQSTNTYFFSPKFLVEEGRKSCNKFWRQRDVMRRTELSTTCPSESNYTRAQLKENVGYRSTMENWIYFGNGLGGDVSEKVQKWHFYYLRRQRRSRCSKLAIKQLNRCQKPREYSILELRKGKSVEFPYSKERKNYNQLATWSNL